MEFKFDLENPLPTTFHDHHHSDTFTTLFHNESDHMPSSESLQSLQASDCFTCIRREIISLILHFSRTFDGFLSYLAINYLDRFLSVQSLPEGKPWISRLVAVSCISLALKMRKTEFSVADIQHDGGFIFDSQRIEKMEYLILGALKWRLRSITPFCFINFFVSLFKFKDLPFRQALKARATEIIFTSQNEIKLLEFKPSIISASALLSASHELFPVQFPCYKKAILNCSYVNKDNLFSCYNVMQDVVMDGYESMLDMVSSTSTPVNVLDLNCLSSADNNDEHSQISIAEEANANGTVRHERDLKRRKIGGYRSDNTYQLSQIQQCN